MLKRLRCLSSEDRGAAAVEFAIVSSVFMLLVFGAMVYGFYFSVLLALDHAASEGARASLMQMNAAGRAAAAQAEVDRVINAYSTLINPDLVTSVIGPSDGNPGLFEVELRYNFAATSFGRLGNFVPMPAEEPNVRALVANGGY